MKICPKCHKKIRNSCTFCPNCGYQFDNTNRMPQQHSFRNNLSVSKTKGKQKWIKWLVVCIVIILIGAGGLHYHHEHSIQSINMETLLPKGNWTFHYINQTYQHAYFHNNYSATDKGNFLNGIVMHATTPHEVQMYDKNDSDHTELYFHLISNDKGLLKFKLAQADRNGKDYMIHGNKIKGHTIPKQALYFTIHKSTPE